MPTDQKESVKVALRQLEYAEDYLQGVANALPELQRRVDELLEEVAELKEDLALRRLAS